MPTSSQPDYVNGVAALRGHANPLAMLATLQELETRAGRVRTAPNAARTLDLDLIAAGQTVCETPTLTLPHPRMTERAFVLVPLCEIAPDWRHPVLGETARTLCGRVRDQRVERLAVSPSALQVPRQWLT